MNSMMTFASLPESTINPSKIGAQSTGVADTSFRPWQWLDRPEDVRMQQKENDQVLYTLLQQFQFDPAQKTLGNPAIHWRVDNRLNLITYLTVALSSTDTYANVAEPGMFKAGYTLIDPATGQLMVVDDVDSAYTSGWTNNATDACNIKLTRTIYNNQNRAIAANSEVFAGLPIMGETGTPKEGLTTVPGDPFYNFIQTFGLYTQMTQMQKNSIMSGQWGTHTHLIETNWSMLMQQVQRQMLFGKRGTDNTSDEGQIYMMNGIVPQLTDNVLTVSGIGNALVYANLSEFWDGLFESANSASMKKHVCGELQFMNILNTARQEAAMLEEPAYNPDLGASQFVVTTGGGKRVEVIKDRFSLQGKNLSDWGITLDAANIVTGEYAGFGLRLLEDMDVPLQAITRQTDAMVGSATVCVVDPDTCGVVKGGSNRIVRRNELGPLTGLND
jgi:hypothetical protein